MERMTAHGDGNEDTEEFKKYNFYSKSANFISNSIILASRLQILLKKYNFRPSNAISPKWYNFCLKQYYFRLKQFNFFLKQCNFIYFFYGS